VPVELVGTEVRKVRTADCHHITDENLLQASGGQNLDVSVTGGIHRLWQGVIPPYRYADPSTTVVSQMSRVKFDDPHPKCDACLESGTQEGFRRLIQQSDPNRP